MTDTYVLSKAATIPPGHNLLIRNDHTKKEWEIHPEILHLIYAAERPVTAEQLMDVCRERQIPEDVVEWMTQEGILTTHTEESSWQKNNWSIPEQFFYATRNMDYADKEYRPEEKKKHLEKAWAQNRTQIQKTPRGRTIELCTPKSIENDLVSVMKQRRTARRFGQEVKKETFSSILYHSTTTMRNIRKRTEREIQKNVLALTESLYSAFEIYVVVQNVEDLPHGLYHYNSCEHKLTIVQEADLTPELIDLSQGQKFLDKAGFTVFITAVWKRFMLRYKHSRAYREILISCAALAHNFLLCATALKTKSFMTPALKDSVIRKLLNGTYEEEALYMLSFGR